MTGTAMTAAEDANSGVLQQAVGQPDDQQIVSEFRFRIGDLVDVQARARITPMGVISAGLATAMIIAAAGFAFGSKRNRHSWIGRQ